MLGFIEDGVQKADRVNACSTKAFLIELINGLRLIEVVFFS